MIQCFLEIINKAVHAHVQHVTCACACNMHMHMCMYMCMHMCMYGFIYYLKDQHWINIYTPAITLYKSHYSQLRLVMHPPRRRRRRRAGAHRHDSKTPYTLLLHATLRHCPVAVPLRRLPPMKRGEASRIAQSCTWLTLLPQASPHSGFSEKPRAEDGGNEMVTRE